MAKKMNSVDKLNQSIKPYAVGKWVDQFLQERGKSLPDWPEWCFMPMAAWYTVVCDAHQDELDASMRLPMQLIPEVAKISALGSWRYSQGIYRFDGNFREALADTIMKGDMPVEVLYRMPEWCLYVETDGMCWLDEPLYGFWVHLEYDITTKRSELRLLLHRKEFLTPIVLHMGNWTITEAIDRATDEAAKKAWEADVSYQNNPDYVQALSQSINPLISLLLYICQDEPEIDDNRQPGQHPQRPKPTKTKKGWRLFPAEKARVWDVGKVTGAKLKSTGYQTDTGRKVSPHLRSAHWHGVWIGPKKDQRFKYNWLPPILVGNYEGVEPHNQ